MKVTFPYMGTTQIYAKLFELLGHEVIMPPRPNRKAIDLGVKYSPEFACYPLKVIMGTYLKAIEKGADTIITSGGHGPCRAGYYGELHKKILEKMGKEIDFIIFDEPKRGYRQFIKRVKKVKGKTSWFRVYKILKTVYYLARSLDRLEKIFTSKRAYVRDKTSFNQTWEEILNSYSRIKDINDIQLVEEEALKKLNGFELVMPPEEDRLKIGLVGEIYVVMEPSVNNNIEEILNNFGAEVERSHYISEWVQESLIPFGRKKAEEILKKGERYIEIIIGDHAKQSVGHIVDYQERGFDGVIHLKPFGCLPELITQSMLDKISEELNLPILSLSIDEQTASANIITRVEAFLDLVRYKKNKRRERRISNE